MLRVKKYICKENIKQYKRFIATKTGLCINDMPHPKGLPLIGTKLELFAAGSGSKLHEYIDYRHKQLGPIFYEILGGNTKLVFINEPEMMKTLFLKLEGKYPLHILPEPWVLYEKLYGSKRGLFFMNGEEWLFNRRIMNKHLLRENSDKWLEEPIKATIQKFVQEWKRKAENGSFVPNLESDLYQLSIDILISILLGGESLTPSKHNKELLLKFAQSVKKIFHTTTKLYGLPVHWCQRLNTKAWRNFKESVDLSILLAQKIVREILNNKQNVRGLIPKLRQDNMSDETITRIVADFVIAAGDTTAYTTLWALLLLSKNESEAHELLKDPSQAKHIIKETMRLYPVAPFLTRILPKECFLGPYKLNEGTPIIASIYTSGRDENNFSQANKFLPYRWDRKDSRQKELLNHVHSASLPFAFGSRSCIGKKIAMIQLTEIISQVVNNFKLSCENKTEVAAITSQVLVPNQEIRLRMSIRD
ncbi:cytochrome P450 315a1, mitochondrial isoform X1 [Ostrinia nubilalis]|uniref:cytochrome P450 315a1, mitochondrial isoform X1 n=2 Tax=Ostrinia nubilalis TaxID=29057 RepID=UPI003082521C